MNGLLMASRALHFGSALMLAGVLAFRWLVLRGAGEKEWADLGRRLDLLFRCALTVLVISGVGLFWAVAAEMSGASLGQSLDAGTWETVLMQTKFGNVFLWRSGLAALLAVTWWRGRPRGRFFAGVTASAAVALLVSLAWTGHAGSVGGASAGWRIGADAAHLLAAAIWPTGLIFFAMFLHGLRRPGMAAPFDLVSTVVRRFSDVSLATVMVLAATGIVNACFLVGSWGALIATGYGQVLCFKIALFSGMLGIAAWNRFRLLPLLFRAKEPRERERLLGRLGSFVRVEWSLAAGIVAVVAVLGTMPPPR
jgi:putative copper resistance protein D